MNVPVLLIIFKRADTTKRVIDILREVKPKQLFVAADGPRANVPEDKQKCEETREMIQIDWDCEVKTFFRNENAGCGLNPSEAISWLFQHVDRGIILEDDCLPNKNFFPFCEELLEKYKNDDRIGMISGNNRFAAQTTTSYSYHFSKHGLIWGWATWKRAWQKFDFKIKLWETLKNEGMHKNLFEKKIIRYFWGAKFDSVFGGDKQVWDYQWTFARYIHHFLTIRPRVNLVANIGFGPEAIHTKVSGDSRVQEAKSIELPLAHPPYLIIDSYADRKLENMWARSAIKSYIKHRLLFFLNGILKK